MQNIEFTRSELGLLLDMLYRDDVDYPQWKLDVISKIRFAYVASQLEFEAERERVKTLLGK